MVKSVGKIEKRDRNLKNGGDVEYKLRGNVTRSGTGECITLKTVDSTSMYNTEMTKYEDNTHVDRAADVNTKVDTIGNNDRADKVKIINGEIEMNVKELNSDDLNDKVDEENDSSLCYKHILITDATGETDIIKLHESAQNSGDKNMRTLDDIDGDLHLKTASDPALKIVGNKSRILQHANTRRDNLLDKTDGGGTLDVNSERPHELHIDIEEEWRQEAGDENKTVIQHYLQEDENVTDGIGNTNADISVMSVRADLSKAGISTETKADFDGEVKNVTEKEDAPVSSLEAQENRIEYEKMHLIYGVNSAPPLHITVICGLQQALLSLSSQLIVSLLVAEAVCASHDDVMKARLLSSTLFMSGVTTIAMNLFGIRLPLFQGAASEYVVPLLLLSTLEGDFCTIGQDPYAKFTNSTTNATEVEDMVMQRIFHNITALQGSLMVAGTVHFLLGFTGLMGVMLRFVGPITIVPTLTLIFIFLVTPVLKFVETSWPIALSTMGIAMILFLYLATYNMPVPVWTPSGGFRIVRYPLHQVFAILISILLNWGLCAILTSAGVFTDDPDNIQYKARTDASSEIISKNPWFTFPYPGQYGPFGISIPALVSCMIATMISVLDSIGDYYACARVCRVPAPPTHAMNRGIVIEGACSFLAGTIGCGHATSSYGGNIGAIGVTKVASRSVFLATGIFYVLFGLFGKFSAAFITIPHPVLGGAILVMFGIFFGVNLSNLEVVSLTSSRNAAILGLSIFVGLMIPTWVQKVKNPVSTGNAELDQYIEMLLGNPNLCGTLFAFFLDNTVPGTREERGIAAWHVTDEEEEEEVDRSRYNEGYEVYMPMFMNRLSQLPIMKYVPFLPYRKRKTVPE